MCCCRLKFLKWRNNCFTNDSIIKDNPELIKEAIAKNEQLARYQYAATRWWYWYLDDSIQNLEPIIIGGTK